MAALLDSAPQALLDSAPQALSDAAPQALLDSAAQSLAERIEQAVYERTGGRIRGLQIRIEVGQIIVTGRVSTYYTKQLVTHAAMDAARELLILNDVEVG